MHDLRAHQQQMREETIRAIERCRQAAAAFAQEHRRTAAVLALLQVTAAQANPDPTQPRE